MPVTAPLALGHDASDPLSYGALPERRATWFPLGCPVEIATDSPHIHEAAESVWRDYPAQTPAHPVRLHVAVSPEDAPFAERPPLPRGHESLISIIDSPHNFAVADLASGYARICLTRNAARDRSWVLDGFLEPLTYMMLGARRFAMIHASSVARDGRALILCGDSGAGKTCLAYMCARSGWTFLSGDAVQVIRDSPDFAIAGRPYSIRFRPTARRLFPELSAHPVTGPRAGGKFDLDCRSESLFINTALEANAAAVVFLNRTNNVEAARLEPYDRSTALRWMERAVFYGDESVRAEQKKALARLLTLPVLRLTWSNLAEAECILRRLL